MALIKDTECIANWRQEDIRLTCTPNSCPSEITQKRPTHLFQSSLGERRTLEVLDGPDFVGELLSLLSLDRRLARIRQNGERLPVLPQINLGP